MERGTTLILKATVLLIGLVILAFCAMMLPMVVKEAADYFPAHWVYPAVILMYIAAIPFYFALYQALKLLSCIDQNNAFSELAVTALKRIKYSAFSITVLYAACSPFLFLMADFDDAPGLLAVGMVIGFASFVVAVFAAVLEKLLKNAIDIKAENDLTV